VQRRIFSVYVALRSLVFTTGIGIGELTCAVGATWRQGFGHSCRMSTSSFKTARGKRTLATQRVERRLIWITYYHTTLAAMISSLRTLSLRRGAPFSS
jgi:hypothetical protein